MPKKIISLDELSRFKSDYDSHLKTLNGVAMYGGGNYAFDSAFNEESTNALQNQVISKGIRELNYELAIIREELFEVLLTEIDYKVSYAINYVIPDSLNDSDGTHRLVYSKTMLKDVEGNGVALNQLQQPAVTSSTTNDLTRSYDNTTKKITISGTASADTTFSLTSVAISVISGHKYLLKACPSGGSDATYYSDISYNSTYKDYGNGVIVNVSANNNVYIRINVKNATAMGSKSFYTQLFDLTKMFGAGNEPTTTSDNRIQWLLSLGYVPYNEGSLVNTTISGVKIGNVDEIRVLPNTYQQVAYIEGTGTQYINPNISFTSNIVKIELKAETSKQATEMCAVGMVTNTFEIGWGSTLNRIFAYVGATTLGYNDVATAYNQKNKFVFEQDSLSATFKLNDLQAQSTNLIKVFIGSGLYLFAYSPTTYFLQGRISYCKIWDNGTLIRDLVPCYRKSDNVIGMYDLVNDTFYTNAGTGTFIKGNNAFITTISLPQTTLLGVLNLHNTLSVVEGNVVEGEQLYNIVHTTNVGTVDLGTLNYNYDSANARFISQSAIPGIGGELKETSFFKNDICALYRNSTSAQNKTFFILSPSNQIYIYDSAYNNATTFKTAMNGVMLQYELATPTQTIVAQDLHFDQVSSIIEQGGTIEPIFEDVPPNITTTFVVKKAVGE